MAYSLCKVADDVWFRVIKFGKGVWVILFMNEKVCENICNVI